MGPNAEIQARRLVKEAYEYTAGRPRIWVSVDRLARRLRMDDAATLEAALTAAEASGWLITDGSESLCLTDAGHSLFEPD